MRELRLNFRRLYADIFWYGVLAGSAMAFIAIYAARLGANGFQISLLTAGPAVMNLMFSLPAGRWLEDLPFIRATFWSATLSRLGYLFFIFLPWWFAGSGQIWGIVFLTVAMSVPGTLMAISFNAMFADVVPPDDRGEVVGKRNALFAVSVTLTTLVCGYLLDRVIFPTNYQIVFGIGFLGAALSTYYLGRLRPVMPPPERIGQPTGDLARPGAFRILGAVRAAVGLRFLTRARGKPLLRLELLRGPFGSFMAAYLVFYTFQYLAIPLFPLQMVNVLDLSDGAISLGNALFYSIMLLVSLRMSRYTARFGHRALLIIGAILYSLYPLLLGLAEGAALYWVASLVGGGVWAVTNVGLVNRLMERVPEDDRPATMALHNLILNCGILAGSFGGPLLAGSVGLQTALLISAGLRLLAGLVLWRWG